MHGLGLLSEDTDERDLFFSKIVLEEKRLPSSVDLTSLQGPVMNQGKLGACTGFALAGLRIFLENKHASFIDNKPINKENIKLNLWHKFLKFIGILDQSSFVNYSPLFIYYEIRKKEGNLDFDSGGTIRTGMKVLEELTEVVGDEFN